MSREKSVCRILKTFAATACVKRASCTVIVSCSSRAGCVSPRLPEFKWRRLNYLTVLPQIVFHVILFWFPFPKLIFALLTVVTMPNQLVVSIALLLSNLTALPSQARSHCVFHLYEPQTPIIHVPQKVSRWNLLHILANSGVCLYLTCSCERWS